MQAKETDGGGEEEGKLVRGKEEMHAIAAGDTKTVDDDEREENKGGAREKKQDLT